jgi:hypothetical protein
MESQGHSVSILSRKEKSVIPGSQHLHGPVPGLTSPYPEGTIQFVRMGNAQDYAEKVYGDRRRLTGWENYFQVYPSWNVLRAYDLLWDRYESRIIEGEINHDVVMSCKFHSDLVISTVPAQVLCYNNCAFNSVPYYMKQLPTPPADQNNEVVVYNGLPEDHWYRWSILGGLCSIETTAPSWSENVDDGWVQGWKAVSNRCTCHPDVVRCGRWAEWTHGVTMYNAYQKAYSLARELANE